MIASIPSLKPLVIAVGVLLLCLEAQSQVRVRGYVRKDGTYVAPHHRSSPDGKFYNNWSTRGNVNPYTGEPGTLVTPPPRSHSGHFDSNSVDARAIRSFPVKWKLNEEKHVLEPLEPEDSESTEQHEISEEREAPDYVSSYETSRELKDTERAKYWKARGYDFDPDYMSAYLMDIKVKDIERAKFWNERGYEFDPDYMSAYLMDLKVKDIERAQFWKAKGYDFDPDYMSSYLMDSKVKDIERAKYWKQKGHDFDPDYMSAYSMDSKVKDIERAKYWRERGFDFDPDVMSAYMMDLTASKMNTRTR